MSTTAHAAPTLQDVCSLCGDLTPFCLCDEPQWTRTAESFPLTSQEARAALIELHECTKCGTFYDPLTADYDTGTDSPVCDPCVNVAYADCEPDQDYLVFSTGVALF